MPVETDSSYSIRLNLEYQGNVKAEFSGDPIQVIIETTDSLFFSSLTWRTGNGLYWADDSTLLKKNRRFNAFLTWNTYPRCLDCTDKAYYDTIFVGIGGNISRSNTVIVKVSNLPVVIDSLKASTRTFKSSESLWLFNVHDSIGKLHIRIFGRDLDSKTPDMTISGSNNVLEKYQGEPFHVSYLCPSGKFKDTLIFTLYDHAQGQAIRELYLDRTYPDMPPVIDSVSINSRIFQLVKGYANAVFESIDTLKFHIFCHEIHDSIRSIKWSLKKNSMKIDAVNYTIMALVCTTSTCNSVAKRIVENVDTLRVVAYDTRGDSTVGYISISKGVLNKAPLITKIIGDNTIVNDTSTEVTTVNVSGYGRKIFAVDVYDPDSNALTCTWKVKNGVLDKDTGKSVTYTAPGILTNDTITVTVSDNEYSVKSIINVNVNDVFPVFDSLAINKKAYKSPVDTVRYLAYYGEQIMITTWIRDIDRIDTVNYLWNFNDVAMVKSKVDNRVILQAQGNRVIDTVTLLITDGTISKKFKVFINVDAPEPSIDSIKFGNSIYKSLQKAIMESAVYPDTFGIILYAHDLQGDTISSGCESMVKSRISKVATDVYKYSTLDSTYTDTITISVKDTKNNTSKNKIILDIKGGKN
jgi:hypothetical protein